MDRVYRRQRHIYDLTRKYYLFGRDRMIGGLGLAPGDSLVEVGCGTARNLIRIARLYPETSLYGLDASAEILRTARRTVERAGLSGRIRLGEGYAEALTLAQFDRAEPFDRVIFPYSLSMIPDWRQALKAAAGSVGERGRIHIVDFADLKGLPGPAAALLRAWLRLFHVSPRVELVEAISGSEGGAGSGTLSFLPGRYAFIWSGNKKEANDLAALHVAGQTQAGGNSGSIRP